MTMLVLTLVAVFIGWAMMKYLKGPSNKDCLSAEEFDYLLLYGKLPTERASHVSKCQMCAGLSIIYAKENLERPGPCCGGNCGCEKQEGEKK